MLTYSVVHLQAFKTKICMAVIGKIRKYSGLLIVIIGIALASFVLQDLFGPKRCNRSQQDFATIGDEKISKVDFDAKVAEQEELYKRQTGKENLTPAENFKNMTDAWDQMERSVILQKEYEELGLAIEHDEAPTPSISPEELYDLFAGEFLHPYIIQNFGDPVTGKVNVQQVQNILQNFDQLKEEEKVQWKKLETAVKEERINTKYNNLIAKGYYIPKAFAKRMYEESNRTAQFRMMGVKYQTISDSAITLTDADYQKYYDAHSYEYEVDPSVDIDYVVWDVLPSATDKKKMEEEVTKTYADFQKTELKDLPLFVNANSDVMYDSTYMKKGTLPVQIDSIMFNSPVGTIVPLYLENNIYHMSCLMQTMMRPDSMKASHILVMYKGAPGLQEQTKVTRTQAQAKATADSILNVLKKTPASFGALALQKSEFPSVKQDTGNLNWFVDGDLNMKLFYDSCLTMKKGEMKVILSNLGYHIIYLTDETMPVKKVQVASITREIKPSSQTFNTYFTQASEFAGQNRTKEAFEQTIAARGLNKRTAQFIQKMTFTLPGLESSREIIRWAFDEKTEKGAISEQVFDTQGKYVVAMLVDRREKGIATLEQVKKYIEPLVKREKKAEQILAKMNTAVGTSKDIYALATKFNSKVDTVTMLTFSSNNMPQYGPEPEVIGTLFSYKPNVLSGPVKGDMAVYLIQMDQILEPPATNNYTMVQAQMSSFFRQRIQRDVFSALKEKTEILDNRIFYY